MTNNKHTPTPWKVFLAKNNGESLLGIGEDTGAGIVAYNGTMWRDEAEAKANAAFIVKAVNHHDELVEMVRELSNNDLGDMRGYFDLRARATNLLTKIKKGE